jgi:hypothetical protein
MKLAKSRLKKAVKPKALAQSRLAPKKKKRFLIKAIIILSVFTVGAWIAIFYLLSMNFRMQKSITVPKTIFKEIAVKEEYIPSANTLRIIDNNPGVAGHIYRMFGEEWRQYSELIARESGFRPDAINPSSGACGLAQALPCSKMQCSLDEEGIDCQLEWIKNYVEQRYGNIEHALVFHDVMNWY